MMKEVLMTVIYISQKTHFPFFCFSGVSVRIYFGSDLLSMLLNSALILDLARLCELMKEFIALNFPALLNFNPYIRVNLLPIGRLLFYSIQSHPAYTHPLHTDISVIMDSFFFLPGKGPCIFSSFKPLGTDIC